jgi:hypothetical protein
MRRLSCRHSMPHLHDTLRLSNLGGIV